MEGKMKELQRAYLNFLTFSTLNLWDVKRYSSQNVFHFQNVVKLRDILVHYNKSISKADIIENKWKIISKINFAGELFLRDFEEIKTYKGNLNLVPDNAIIFSKINARHGCIYFHKKNEISFAVSSEYPTFKFDESKVNGEFIQKLLRTTEFKKLLNSKVTGISKSRVKKDEFLDIEIPLPPIEEQGNLVAAYQDKIEQAKRMKQEFETLEQAIEAYLFEELGVFQKGLTSNRKVIILNFIK